MRKNRSIEPPFGRRHDELMNFRHNELEHWADDMFHGLGMPRMHFGGFNGMMREMDNMFQEMHSHFENSFKAAEDLMQHPGHGGHFYKQTIVQKSNLDPSGNPRMERYEDKVAKAFGSGHKVAERQQLYQNSAGYQKAGHERTMDNRGTKVVCERLGHAEERRHNYYKNLEEEKVQSFDHEWQSMARNLGLKTNTAAHALPYGGGSTYAREPAQITYDNHRRGAYVPSHLRNERNPVNVGGAIAAPYEPLQPAVTNPLPLPAPSRQPHAQREHQRPARATGPAPTRPSNVRLNNAKGQKPRIG